MADIPISDSNFEVVQHILKENANLLDNFFANGMHDEKMEGIPDDIQQSLPLSYLVDPVVEGEKVQDALFAKYDNTEEKYKAVKEVLLEEIEENVRVAVLNLRMFIELDPRSENVAPVDFGSAMEGESFKDNLRAAIQHGRERYGIQPEETSRPRNLVEPPVESRDPVFFRR